MYCISCHTLSDLLFYHIDCISFNDGQSLLFKHYDVVDGCAYLTFKRISDNTVHRFRCHTDDHILFELCEVNFDEVLV